MTHSARDDIWPALSLKSWRETLETLHLWTQVVGKVRLEATPWLNHSWQVALYVTERGLTTSPIPYEGRSFALDFDFIDHRLALAVSDGQCREMPLRPQSVAAFYREAMAMLGAAGLDIAINERPSEIADAIPFSEDDRHDAYDADAVHRFWTALVQIDRVFKRFRTGFLGKSSPVHFFWGSFDLAVTRFSGRPAPAHPGGAPGMPDIVAREAYSHEVSSAGFWPGAGGVDEEMFYAYAYPTPEAFPGRAVAPEAAFYDTGLGEFLLPYEAVRAAADPDAALLEFLQTTYEAAADTAGWDRASLECPLGVPGQPRRHLVPEPRDEGAGGS